MASISVVRLEKLLGSAAKSLVTSIGGTMVGRFLLLLALLTMAAHAYCTTYSVIEPGCVRVQGESLHSAGLVRSTISGGWYGQIWDGDASEYGKTDVFIDCAVQRGRTYYYALNYGSPDAPNIGQETIVTVPKYGPYGYSAPETPEAASGR